MRAAIAEVLLCASLLAASPAAAATLVGNRHDRSERAAARQSSAHGPLAASSDEAVDVSAETAPPGAGNQPPAISFVAEGSRLNAKVLPNEFEGDRYLANFRIPPGARQILANGSGGKNWSVVGLLTQSDVPEPATWSLMYLGIAAAGAVLRRKSSAVRPVGPQFEPHAGLNPQPSHVDV